MSTSQDEAAWPLLHEEGGFEFPGAAGFGPYDERLLRELHDVEAGSGCLGGNGETPFQHEHVDDADVLKMKQLIRDKPRDVIQYLEEEGVAKLGEFEVQDAIAFKAFNKDSILTVGADHFEVDWETMWRQKLSEYSRSTEGIGWTTKVLMEAHVVNLRDAAAEGSKGLLHPLLKRYNAHGCSAAVFALPAVQAVIHFKWTNWARRFLLWELGCYCAWLVAYTCFTLIFQQEDWTMELWELLEDEAGFSATVFSLLTFIPMAPFLYMELCTIAVYGWGWVQPWNVLDLLSYALQVVICVLHLQRSFVDEGWFSILVATQHVLMWTKLHYFARAFNPTKNTIIDTIKIVLVDMRWFLAFLTLTMVGFGLAFYSLFRQDREKFPDFANIWHSFASMFSYCMAMFDYNVFYNSTNPTAAMVLFIIFEFTMNVLLLNVLIASMTNSFSKITQDEGLRLLASKAEIIDELESTLPHWVRPASWYPPFVHILKFHPDATYEVNLNSVWSGMGLMENNLLGAQQETRLRVEELEDRMAKVHRKLDVLIKLLISGLGPPPPPHHAGLAAAGHSLTRQPTGLHPAGLGLGGGSVAPGPVGAGAGAFGGPFYGGVAPWLAPHAGAAAPAAAAGGCGSGSSGQGAWGGGAPRAGSGSATPQRHGGLAGWGGGGSLSQLPEQLAAVSGPFVGPGFGGYAAPSFVGGQERVTRGLARHSVPATVDGGGSGAAAGGAPAASGGGASSSSAAAATGGDAPGPWAEPCSGDAQTPRSSSTAPPAVATGAAGSGSSGMSGPGGVFARAAHAAGLGQHGGLQQQQQPLPPPAASAFGGWGSWHPYWPPPPYGYWPVGVAMQPQQTAALQRHHSLSRGGSMVAGQRLGHARMGDEGPSAAAAHGLAQRRQSMVSRSHSL